MYYMKTRDKVRKQNVFCVRGEKGDAGGFKPTLTFCFVVFLTNSLFTKFGIQYEVVKLYIGTTALHWISLLSTCFN